jgi:hypothetical protein
VSTSRLDGMPIATTIRSCRRQAEWSHIRRCGGWMEAVVAARDHAANTRLHEFDRCSAKRYDLMLAVGH